MDRLLLVESPFLTAAVVVDAKTGAVKEASPPLRYLLKTSVEEIWAREDTKGWSITEVGTMSQTPELWNVAQSVLRKARIK